AALLFGLVAAAGADDKKDKEKPKDAPTLDDRTASLTEITDGKEKTTKIDLKYSLKVKGYFDKDGYNIEELDDDGPAAMLGDADGNPVAKLEKGDIITEVDGKKVKSAQDYAKAVDGAADHAKVKVKVRDVNSGQEMEFYANSAKR